MSLLRHEKRGTRVQNSDDRADGQTYHQVQHSFSKKKKRGICFD